MAVFKNKYVMSLNFSGRVGHKYFHNTGNSVKLDMVTSLIVSIISSITCVFWIHTISCWPYFNKAESEGEIYNNVSQWFIFSFSWNDSYGGYKDMKVRVALTGSV